MPPPATLLMSRIFLSHSSRDNFAAVVIGDWLKDQGWDDVFLDLDPAQGIHPGERWERALYEHAAECEAVLFLVSSNWLASEWCRREHELARKLNKRIFVALIEEIPIDELPQYIKHTHQIVALAAGEDHRLFHPKLPVTHEEGHITFSAEGLSRLKAGLTQAGLDPRFFAWPPENEPGRAPYRGLEPLEGVDAGIFFGREAPVIDALDMLRGLREAACPRLFVILGASGAGKSSFLRAGLLPRLARDERNFTPLPIIRPERAAIAGANGLVAALAEATAAEGLTTTRATIRGAVANRAAALRPILKSLTARTGDAKSPTLVFTIDQAEELFRAEGAREGEALLALLRDLVTTDDPAVIALFAIRSDSYNALEHAKPLEGLSQKAFPLLPMPRGAYQTVIEGPARRLAQTSRKFEIDPRLTQALLEDIEKGGGSDALPLLSFTLEQLYRDYHAAGRLSRTDYDKFNGLGGAIDGALARVFVEADKDARIPKNHDARLSLLRCGLIPWLAGVDPDTKTARRRIARAVQIPHKAQPLIDLLVEQRLLSRDVDKETGETTIEPAHEALLRQWGELERWLAEDFGRLATLEALQRAARDWNAKGRDTAWVTHGGARLEEAEALDARPDLAAMLKSLDRAYLFACRDKESMAEQVRKDAEERSALLAAHVSRSLTDEGSLDAALLLLLDSAHLFDDQSIPDEIRIAFTKALEKKARIETRNLFPNMQVFETDAALLLVDPKTNDIWKLTDSIDSVRLIAGSSSHCKILGMRQSAKGDYLIAVRENLEVERINLTTGAIRKIAAFPTPSKHPDRSYVNEQKDWLPPVEFLENDLIMRRSLLSGYHDALEFNCQIMDADSGRIVEGMVPASVIISGTSTDNLFLYNRSGAVTKTFRLVLQDNYFELQDAGIPEETDSLLQHISCLQGIAAKSKSAIWEQLKEHAQFPDSRMEWKKYNNSVLITIFVTGSSGIWRDDRLFDLEEIEKINSMKIQEEFSKFNPSNSDLTWIGVKPDPNYSNWLFNSIGVLFNRDAVVKSSSSVELHFRHPTVPTHARFISHDRLVVVDAENGHLWAHDFGERSRRSDTLFSTPTNTIIGTGDPIETLHHGTCVGRSIPLSGRDTFPDGREVYYDTSGITNAGEKHEIRVVSGNNTTVIQLDDDSHCITVSADRSRLLVLCPTDIRIYDFDRVLKCGSLTGGEISIIHVSKRLNSGLFVGQSTDSIVTTDFSNRVLLWKHDKDSGNWTSTEIFHGEHPIYYAETNAEGTQLLIIEDISGGNSNMRGSVYSIKSQQKWYDLGGDYKWLGATFINNSEIAVSKHGAWTNVFPILSLSALVELAKKELTEECRPKEEGDYRSSPCWPTTYR
jgi:hypothetical protein